MMPSLTTGVETLLAMGDATLKPTVKRPARNVEARMIDRRIVFVLKLGKQRINKYRVVPQTLDKV